MTAESTTVATELCSACGMCCNGVLFHTVRLQGDDSAQALVALGLRVKHKTKGDFFNQPCVAYRESCCTIYESRPQRCRLFECKQLLRVTSGETTPDAAMEKIREAKDRVTQVEEFFRLSGETNDKGPLTKRYERLTAEPVDAAFDAEGAALRERMAEAMRELEELLEREFRVK